MQTFTVVREETYTFKDSGHFSAFRSPPLPPYVQLSLMPLVDYSPPTTDFSKTTDNAMGSANRSLF